MMMMIIVIILIIIKPDQDQHHNCHRHHDLCHSDWKRHCLTLDKGWILRAKICWTGQLFLIFVVVNFINMVHFTITPMIRVERQGKDLMERQKDVSKDSSKLGKEEVRMFEGLFRLFDGLCDNMFNEFCSGIWLIIMIIISFHCDHELREQMINNGDDQVQKLGKLETAVDELGQRMDSTGRLADTLVAECSRKVWS